MEWIRVSERLPENETDVLLAVWVSYAMDQKIIQGYWWNNRYWIDLRGNKQEKVSHWMPLPEPPQIK